MTEKPQQVLLPSIPESTQCPRCDQYHCEMCVTFELVTFQAEEEQKNEAGHVMVMNWVDMSVCPWCYNQLIERFIV